MSAQVKIRLLDDRVEYRKLKVVESLVSRLYAQWVIRGVIAEMLPETPGLARLKYIPAPNAPDTAFPAAELPGLSFQLHGKKQFDGTETRNWLKGESCPSTEL